MASYWMGQSIRIALDNYLHPTDDQYNDATEKKEPEAKNPEPCKCEK